MRIVKSEWHQVERRYALELEREQLDEIYPDLNSEEQDEIWNRIIEDDYDFSQLIDDSNDAGVFLDWDWLDEDDWWTDRKGGYEVTYEIQPDYEPPKTDRDYIRDLRNEVNALLAKLGEEEKYDTRPDGVRLAALQELFDEELEDIPVLENEELWSQRVIDEQQRAEDAATKIKLNFGVN